MSQGPLGPRLTTLAAAFLFVTPVWAEPGQVRVEDDQVVAVCGAHTLRTSELQQIVTPRLSRLGTEQYRIRRGAIEEWITNTLLAQAAAARHLSVDALLQTDVEDRVPVVTDDEARAIVEYSPDRFRNLETASAIQGVKQELRQRRIAIRKQEFLGGLRRAAHAQIFLEPPRVQIPAATGPSKGPITAPVTLVLFADFQCSYCARFNSVVERVLRDFEPNVRLVYRHFPLQSHGNAGKAAEAAACAAEQGRFWEMHDLLFANQQRLTTEDLKRYAGALKLDAGAFDTCMVSLRTASTWQQDKRDGDAYGVVGTPTVFVNGRPLVGLASFEALSQTVEEELRNAKDSERAAQR